MSVEYSTADCCRLTVNSLAWPAGAAIKQESCQISQHNLTRECIHMGGCLPTGLVISEESAKLSALAGLFNQGKLFLVLLVED